MDHGSQNSMDGLTVEDEQDLRHGPPELLGTASLVAEMGFVLVCAAGQLIFTLTLGQVVVAQTAIQQALAIAPTQTPWLVGASLIPSGLSVIIAGSLADLIMPKRMMVSAFAWAAACNAVAAGAVVLDRPPPARATLFLVARALHGLAVGVLVSASMSLLGRVYKPGIRKTRVFSLMGAGAPFGFWIGCLQGGALSSRLPWIFASTAIFLALLAIGAYMVLPNLGTLGDGPPLEQFDYLGAFFATSGCGLVLSGLTQGPPTGWHPYTYTLVILGVLMLTAFSWVERRAVRPLIPSGLWRTPGLKPLMVAYFLGFGGYSGAWQFFMIQFWQRYQSQTPLTIGLYILPNAIVGVLAAYIVSKTLHILPGHVIFASSMISFAMGPVFSLPQDSSTSYWALSFPGICLATFGPDMSFAAAAIFITSSVPRSYQGAAGALLVTTQNLSSAVMTSVANSLGVKVELVLPDGEIGLEGIRAIWWLALASALMGAIITIVFVRIPKTEERDHIQ